MKAWACVGTHGKIYGCFSTQDLRLLDRLEIYMNEKSARNNAISENYVREVTITVHKKKSTKRKDK